MKTRAITAFFFTIVMLSSMFLGATVFTAFFLLLALIGLLEFYKLIGETEIKPLKFAGCILAIVGFTIFSSQQIISLDAKYNLLLIPLTFLVFLIQLFRKSNVPFGDISYTFIGLIFVVVPFLFFHDLGFLTSTGDFSFHFPLAFLLMLWANDTGAYLFGVKLGKTKLFERHSPKKSWEGFFGGIFIALIISYVISLYFDDINTIQWAFMAILIGVVGTAGDLVESMLKRSLNVKDSGSFLPGHGGLLDRFDGLLLAAPLVFCYLYLILY